MKVGIGLVEQNLNQVLLTGNVTGGKNILTSNDDIIQDLNKNSYINLRNGIDGESIIHANKINHITTNFQEKIIIGGLTDSANSLLPTWQGANSLYQQVQINEVNLRGNISFGSGLNSTASIIGIGAEYNQIRFNDLHITPNDATYNNTTLRVVKELGVIDVNNDEIFSIGKFGNGKIAELYATTPATEVDNTTVNRESILRLNHTYWTKATSDVTGVSASKILNIGQNRTTNDGVNYLGYGYINYNAIESLKILENGGVEFKKIGINIEPTIYDLDVLGRSRFAGQIQNANVNSIYIGKTIDSLTVNETSYGYRAGNSNLANNLTAVGFDAGKNNSGGESTVIGVGAGWNNSGSNLVAIGFYCGKGNSANSVTAFGYYALNNNSGMRSVGLGQVSGTGNTGSGLTAVGYASGNSNTGINVSIVGNEAGRNNSGGYLSSLGYSAGNSNNGNNLVAIGQNAGLRNKGNSVVSIGQNAGIDNAKSNAFIISNSQLPSYVDAPTAQGILTIANGCVAGNTYLYFNELSKNIEAVRFI